MARYIDAECAKSIYLPCDVWSLLDRVPTADVIPLIHAHWVPHEDLNDCAYCSNCNGGLVKHFWVRPFDWDWCPDCGAKMDEEENND